MMKKIVFLLLMFVGLLPQISHADDTPKAILAREQIWDEENQTYTNKYSSDTNYTLYFVYDDITYNTNDICNIVVYDAEHPEVIKVVQSWTKLVDYNDHDQNVLKRYSNSDLRNNFNPTYEYGNVGNRNSTIYNLTGRVPWRQQASWKTTERVVFASSFSNCEVTNMRYWFAGGTGWPDYGTYVEKGGDSSAGHGNKETALKKIDGGRNINTTGVTKMARTFGYCKDLEEIEGIDTWQFGNVVSCLEMFINCESLITLNLSNWDIKALTSTARMFQNCIKLERIFCPNDWQTMYNKISTGKSVDMFEGCTSLVGAIPYNSSKKDIGYANPTTGYFTPIGYAVLDGTTLSFYGGNPEDLYPGGEGTLYWLTNDTGTEVPGWYAHNADISTVVFDTSFSTTQVKSCYSWFDGCTNLTTITDMANLPTHAVTNMEDMFNGCSSLKHLDVSNWNTDSLTNMKQTFYGCSNLTSLSFGADFSTANIDLTVTNSTFAGCPKLRYIDFYASDDWNGLPAVKRSDSSNMFYGVPQTTVIYLPHDAFKFPIVSPGIAYADQGDTRNVVWSKQIEPMPYAYSGALYCDEYYSEDKVDIELPHDFNTLEAVYTRSMSTNYGSVILPYAFTTNDNIQAYTLDEEHTETMYFEEAETVPAHTPFFFKKLTAGTTADFTMTNEMGAYGITVYATRSTSAAEDTWTGGKGSPYTGSENLTGWTTKGYYVSETVSDYDDLFYIKSDKFYRANGETLVFPPHRVTFHGAWEHDISNGTAKDYLDIETGERIVNAIEAAETEKTVREAEAIYDVQGRKFDDLHKGVNIIRMNDGTTKKVIIK